MTKLLKYEIRKTWMAKLIFLGITAVAEVFFLIGTFLPEGSKAGDYLLSISIPLLILTAVTGIIAIGIQSLLTLHRDMNTKEGYMLYMTPKNSFEILGAKMLENGVSLFLSGAFFFLLGFLDITVMLARRGQLNQLWEFAKSFLNTFQIDFEITPAGVLALIFSLIASWLATVTVAYLADIISSALLNGKRFNWLLTFVFFIALNVLMSWILRKLPHGSSITMQLVISGIGALVFAVIMYFVSAYIMERCLSV